ncbi:MAG: DUF3892 domain-containing protein [Candidatus Methylacidiphilales bacterium]|nr:DUF3892 domain-containing protein [Candidatus Methylacidiphilales bacterium]
MTRTGKDKDGDITKLCNPQETWSPRHKADAIRDIETRAVVYKVAWTDGLVTDVRVVNGPTRKYLRTDRDTTTRNNLDDLPDC